MKLFKLFFAYVIAIVGISLNFSVQSSEYADSVEVFFDQKITMRDGTKLSVNIWKPAGGAESLPVVFTMTPYIASGMHNWGAYFAEAGFVFASVDRRGRGLSEGIFNPLEDSGKDGYDVVEWLSKQSWSNGKVAMRGASYNGMVQWKVMAQNHPNLVSTMPIASVYPGFDFPMLKNIKSNYTSRWLAYTNSRSSHRQLFSDSPYWRNIKRRIYSSNMAFKDIPNISVESQRIFDKYLAHPFEDEYWKSLSPTVEQYSKIDIPVLTITGYFDDDQYGALRYYKEHRKHASSDGKENHYLLIGPWDHKGTQRPQAEYHGLKFDESSKLDISQLQIDWLNWVLNNAEKPVILKRNVNYYVMGEEVWRHTDSLDSLFNENRKFYLSSPNSEASDVFNSGLLSEKQSNEKDVDSYFYDPLDNYDLKVPKSAFDYGGMWSQKAAFANNILIYHSAPLSEEIIIAGQISFTASISMNVPDTDMKVYLFAVMPDGQSLRIATDVMRARYRNGLTKEELVPIGKVQKYVFDAFRLSARKLPKGTRLRLVLTAFDDYNYEKNYNSSKPNSEQSGKDAVTAKIKLHLGKDRTFLTLPVDTRNYGLENKH